MKSYDAQSKWSLQDGPFSRSFWEIRDIVALLDAKGFYGNEDGEDEDQETTYVGGA